MMKADELPILKTLIKNARDIACTLYAFFVYKRLMSDARVYGVKRPMPKLTNADVNKFQIQELFFTILK